MGSETPYPFMKTLSLINRSTKELRLANQHFFPFKSNGRKCDLECPIHRIISSCEIEGAYLSRILSISDQKKYIMIFSENKKNKKKNILVNLKNESVPVLLSCFQIFYYFMFLKNRHNPC